MKLRGVNRHDISYDNGRCITHELVEKDVRFFKEANINFIRTSHYPPRPDFLDLCDEYGFYVEDEIAVAFLGYAVNLTQDDPAFREQFLRQFADMIERDKSHPSVIIWSLANESRWGENHGLMLQYVRRESPDRLTIFSYPVTQTEEDEMDWSVWGKNEYGHHGARDFSSMKSYIYNASLKAKDNSAGFTALSTGADSVRMELQYNDTHIISDRSPKVHYSGNRFEKSNRYHSFDGTETWSNEVGDWCEYTFEGYGIVWYSNLDRICGSANIYVDGRETGDTRFIIDNEFNYPEISRADYCKPAIRVETGYSGTVYVKLG